MDPESEVEWLPHVAAVSLVYPLLELELPGIAVPVVVVSSEYGVLTLVLPAEIVPWLPPSLVPLGELDTGLPAADGQQVAVALFRVDSRAAGLLVPYSGRVPWCVDQRWPAAAGLRTLAAAAEETFTLREVDLQRDWSLVLPPALHAIGPPGLDHQLGGALSRSPWRAVMDIPWPPREPDGEATGREDQDAEPAPYLDDDGDEDPDDADFFSALEGPALGDALRAAAMREAQRASASAPSHGLGFAEEVPAGAADGRLRAVLSGSAAVASGDRRPLSSTPSLAPAAALAAPAGAPAALPNTAAAVGGGWVGGRAGAGDGVHPFQDLPRPRLGPPEPTPLWLR